MGESLQEQLLKAGLVDKSKASQVRKQKSRKARQERKGARPAPNSQAQRERPREQEEKSARDRALNEQRNEARRQREIAAQVSQLVKSHRHPRGDGENARPFHFENKGKIKRMYVSPETSEMITAGKLVIVNHNGVFELVPPEVAEKIRQRNPGLVIDLPQEGPAGDDDPYAAYTVPDDLVW